MNVFKGFKNNYFRYLSYIMRIINDIIDNPKFNEKACNKPYLEAN